MYNNIIMNNYDDYEVKINIIMKVEPKISRTVQTSSTRTKVASYMHVLLYTDL